MAGPGKGAGAKTGGTAMRRNTFDKVLAIAGVSLGVVLLAVAGLLLWGSAYIHNQVTSQLAAQKVYFPPASAFAHPKAGTEITPSMIPSVSQYAGQQLLTGQQAEAYANNFIAVHLQEIGAGKTYAQLSTEAMALPPTSAKYTAVEAQVQTVFRGDTLRSMLLNAFSWWKVSQIAYIASLVSFALGGIALATGIIAFAWSGLATEADKKVFAHTPRETVKVA
jgi:hypothetical protein